jgi:type I restriction enzyme S subunit
MKEIAFLGAGNPAPQGEEHFENGTYPFVRVRDMGELRNDVYIYDTNDHVNEKAIRKMKLFPKGTVLFTKSGMSTLLNQRAILGKDMYVVSHIGTVSPLSEIQSEWFYYWLRTVGFESLIHATTLPSLKLSTVNEIAVPLAPLNEQRRVVAKVEALFAESKTAREALDKIPAILRRFRQSILAKAFRGELTQRNPNDEPVDNWLIKFEREYKEPRIEKTILGQIPQEWKWVSIEGILLDKKRGIRTGPFGTLLKKADLKTEGVSLIGIQNVGSDQFIVRDKQFISETKAQELANYQLLPGDVVISRSGTIDRACVIPTELGFSIMSTNLIRISVNTNLCLPQLLSKFINYSSIFQSQIEEKSKGTTRRFLNNKILCSVLLPLPPIDEQKRIVARIEELLSAAGNVEDIAQNTRQKLDMIDQAILAKAFRGELVSQDPNDEPPAKLLQRIRVDTKRRSTRARRCHNRCNHRFHRLETRRRLSSRRRITLLSSPFLDIKHYFH